ncbi:MAG: hypothetical protein II291_05035 [Succinivibrio sp.]|nr:hypothetical protein [Succinivibrio sp.]
MEINKDQLKSQALSLVEKIKQDKKVAIGVISGAVLFVLAIVVFLASGPAKPKTPQEQFRAMLSQAVNNDSNLDKILKGFKLDGDKLEVVRDHYKKMFDDELLDFYVKKLDEQGIFKSKELDKKRAFATAFKTMNDIAVEGILKTSSKDREAFFNYNKTLITTLSPRTCKMYVIGDPRLFAEREMQTSSSRVFKKMTIEQLEAYLSAQRAAAHSVAKGNVPSVTLTKEQAEKAGTLLEEANSKQMESLPAFKQKKIANAANDLTRAMPMDACDFGKFVYKSADSITDPADRDIVILNLLGAAQQ